MNTAISPHASAAKRARSNSIFAATPLSRRLRTMILAKEVSAASELSTILREAPQQVLQRFPELALSLCGAGTAGLSLLVREDDGAEYLRWEAIAGAMAGNEGQVVPRNFSLCGLCLDAGSPIVIAEPERVFKYFRNFRPAITEVLVVPLYDTGKRPLGAIWMARHDASHFAPQDGSIIEEFAIQFIAALKLIKLQGGPVTALNLIASHMLKARRAAQQLSDESDHLQIAERSERGLLAKLEFKEAAIIEIDHRAKNTLQVVATLLAVQSRGTTNQEARDVLQEAYRRLHVLARLHELLYVSNTGSRDIQMSELFDSLATALRQSFGERSTEIALRLTVEPIAFTESLAIPLALLANELITNAYKHAFPEGSTGEIELTLKRAMAGVVLQVSDNGIGTRSDVEGSGLGQKLIRSFSAHLNGTLVYSKPEQGDGTTVTVTIAPPQSEVAEDEHRKAIAQNPR